MDTNDYYATPQELKDQLSERYPGARCAYLKTGGAFPFLSRPDEVNLHLQIHPRWVGVDARPDLVQTYSKDGNGGSPNENRNDDCEGTEDPPKDAEGSSESSSNNYQLPSTPEENTESHNFDDQLSNAKSLFVSPQYISPFSHNGYFEKQLSAMVSEPYLRLIQDVSLHHLHFLSMCTLYILGKYHWELRELV